MLKIGITGGIGSGKTTVCKMFGLLGVPIYNADEAAKNLMQNNIELQQKIIKAFGNSIINDQQQIDKQKLSATVFAVPEKLQVLNNLVHPAVARDFEEWISKQKKAKYVLKEAAILFESGAYRQVDKVITVSTPLELRIIRAMQRLNLTRNEIEQRIKNQWSDELKIEKSDFVIYNNEQQLLIPQIVALDKMVIEKKIK
jgi:dephospho-CoA kinase